MTVNDINALFPTAEEAVAALQATNALFPTAEEFAERLERLKEHDPFFAYLMRCMAEGRPEMAMAAIHVAAGIGKHHGPL